MQKLSLLRLWLYAQSMSRLKQRRIVGKKTLGSFGETSERQIPSFSIFKTTDICFIDNIQQGTIQKLYEFIQIMLKAVLNANAAKTP